MTKKTTQTYSAPPDSGASLLGGALAGSAFAAQDLAAIRTQLDGINAAAGNVSSSLTKAFTSASASGRAFNATLATVAASLSQMLAGVGAGFLSQGLSTILGNMFGGAFGGLGGGPTVASFADGGVVASPTFFGAGGSVGLMGERGAEAILPLARGPNGQLGVAAGAGANRPTNVTVNIQTADAESFRRSETQVAAALARAVARGRRGL